MQSLTWNGNEIALWVSVLIVPITIALALWNWRAHGSKKFHGLLEIFRVLLVLLVILIFWQPEWVEESANQRDPVIAVISDYSSSMETRDTEIPDQEGLTTRAQVRNIINDTNKWSGLGENVKVVYSTFGEAQLGKPSRSNLYTPIKSAIEGNPGIKGVFVISDGDWNTGPPPSQLASMSRLANVPIFSFPLGTEERLPDIRITEVAIPSYGVTGKALRIPVSLRSSLAQTFPATVKVRLSNGDRMEKTVAIPAKNKAEVVFEWKPKEPGDYSIDVEVNAHPNEAILENNKFTNQFQVQDESIQVLVVDSVPRWEYRYLRNALSRDPGIELSCLLYHPGLTKRGGGDENYIKSFPESLNELSRYDVIILGDVGVTVDQLTDEDCRQIKGVVENQAAGLILIPGFEGNELSLVDTELEPLIPIQFDLNQPRGWGSRDPEHFTLSREGRKSLLTRLGDTEEENLTIWEDLPGFNWYAPILRAKVGSQVLATHQNVSNENGLIPLLVTKTQGQGKVLFMGTDSAWKWREGVEDQYHYRFWGQVIRWMAYQRNMAEGQTLRLFFFPERPQARNTVKLNVNAMMPSGEPLQAGDIRARLTSPTGKTQSLKLSNNGEEWGLYEGSWTPDESGSYNIRIESRDTGDILEYEILVEGLPLEVVGEPARLDVLEELSRLTNGKVLSPEQANNTAGLLNLLPASEPLVKRIAIWSHPATLAALVILFAIFWILRKKAGLI